MSYIKREPLLQIAKELQGNVFGTPLIVRAIENAPEEDVTEVKHGHWIERIEKPDWLEDDVEVYYECSVCGVSGIGPTPYCHECGARMNEERKMNDE